MELEAGLILRLHHKRDITRTLETLGPPPAQCHRTGDRAHEDGHARLERHSLKDILGDALHAVMCATSGYLRLNLAAVRLLRDQIGATCTHSWLR